MTKHGNSTTNLILASLKKTMMRDCITNVQAMGLNYHKQISELIKDTITMFNFLLFSWPKRSNLSRIMGLRMYRWYMCISIVFPVQLHYSPHSNHWLKNHWQKSELIKDTYMVFSFYLFLDLREVISLTRIIG